MMPPGTGHAARAWEQPGVGTGTLVRLRLVSEQDDVKAKPGSRGKEAENNGAGWLGSDQVNPH